jgi:hypothetical protein
MPQAIHTLNLEALRKSSVFNRIRDRSLARSLRAASGAENQVKATLLVATAQQIRV